nr:alpha/beta fold hydrolase [Gammaproteobacteria bacterium]
MNPYLSSKGQGKNLVLLPGWAMPVSIFSELVNELAQYYRVITVDLWNAEEFDFTDMETVLAHLIKLLPEPAIYLGWSLGGLIAMALACFKPAQVTQLVTLGATPCFLKIKDWPGMSHMSFKIFSKMFELEPQETFLGFLELVSKKNTQ